MNWKHRKPNEHLFHFNPDSLRKHFELHGYEYVTHSCIEDGIRKGEDENILTGIFKKK
jgi:hypothetical protein